MLEVFAYKRYKKHKVNKKLREINAKEALSSEDEEFIRKSMDNQSKHSTGQSMFKFLSGKKNGGKGEIVPPTEEELAAVKTKEEGTGTSQEEDLQRALSSLNLAVEKKTAFSLSDETRALLKEFTQILKDIQAGGPHAYSDLTTFLHNSNDKLNSLFDNIPGFLKSLISTLPFPLARKLDKKSPKEVGVDILKDLAKPGVITGLLKNIMTVLRTRFPAFVGSNALLSLGVFVLLFGVWYCYKRGREERLKLGPGEAPEPEVLVEGTTAQAGDADHGTGTVIADGGIPILETRNLSGLPVEQDDVPLQVESEPLPASLAKKQRKSWFKSG